MPRDPNINLGERVLAFAHALATLRGDGVGGNGSGASGLRRIHDVLAWRHMERNLLAAYAAFYNPVNFLRAFFKFDRLRTFRILYQLHGMAAVTKSIAQNLPWIRQLMSGSIEKYTAAPRPKLPLRRADTLTLDLERAPAAETTPLLLNAGDCESMVATGLQTR